MRHGVTMPARAIRTNFYKGWMPIIKTYGGDGNGRIAQTEETGIDRYG